MAVELSQSGSTNPIRKARYQITKNVFVHCYMEILDANNQEVRLLLGVKRRSDTQVSVGTRIFISTSEESQGGGNFSAFSVTVLKIEEIEGKFVHICTPISKASTDERRSQTRLPVNFPVLLVDSQTLFLATNGTPYGLGLTYTAQRAILKLTVNETYDFKLNCKGEDCHLKGVIKHIQYDWRTFQHQIGIHFPNLQKDERMILNIVVDPDYTVPISNTQTIDGGAGKISRND
ncbi:hypothetical protein [Vampirovibrio sp.]|uniref:hypothetical protein n=1 Tax=Vampirovibrio sp. TaxID=2717857 RepID=UPI003593CC90